MDNHGKKGFWIQTKNQTVDGDPEWQCSLCGGCRHIYGTMHLNNKKIVCFDCGAVNDYSYNTTKG